MCSYYHWFLEGNIHVLCQSAMNCPWENLRKLPRNPALKLYLGARYVKSDACIAENKWLIWVPGFNVQFVFKIESSALAVYTGLQWEWGWYSRTAWHRRCTGSPNFYLQTRLGIEPSPFSTNVLHLPVGTCRTHMLSKLAVIDNKKLGTYLLMINILNMLDMWILCVHDVGWNSYKHHTCYDSTA